MKFRTVAALVALVVGASAQTTVPPAVQNSVLMVLATALPADSVSYALASSSAFAAEMASSLSAGNPPSWYQALPSDVKSLLPVLYPASAMATPTPSMTPSSTPLITSIIDPSSAFPTAANSSTVSVRSPTLSASGSRSASASAPASTGGAAGYPTAAIGAGLGAAIGFLGMLAL